MPREDFYDGDNMTPEVCTTLCGQSLMTYALLKAGTQCYCADALPSVGDNIADNLCGRPCSGKPGLKCGGTKHVAVYKALGTYATPTFTLTIPTTVNLGENVSFSVSALPESDYTIDFGNGQTMRSFQTDMFFAFPTAGKFMVRASATTSEYGEPVLVSAETEVEVKVPVVSSLVCPSAVETSEEFECTLNLIQSSNADFTLDFFGGIATSSDSVAGTYIVITMQCNTILSIAIPGNNLLCGYGYTIPYHTIPYHTIPYHTIPYHTIPYHTIPYHTIPYHTIPYHTIPYLTIPYHTIPYHTIPCHTTPCHTRDHMTLYNTRHSINLIVYVSIILETLQGVVGDDVTPNIKSTETAGVYLLPDLKFESEGKVQLWEVLAMKPGVIRLLVSINCDFVRMETLEDKFQYGSLGLFVQPLSTLRKRKIHCP